MTSLTTNPDPQEKFFFRVQSTRLHAFFEIFAESLERTGAEIFMRKATCVWVFFSQNPQNHPVLKVLKDSASLLVRNEKKFFGWVCGFFVSDIIREVVLGSF